ncbi:hypothetical protein AKJ51_01520 [candidate division MSBL1 archaeon SCGC-AAA382A20]|uniref:DNA polymerase sliding clamp n=1 Tax=candidate division MSBL1 archaeon SCGC-AAA382A20 TaxID=1698280 RepID=A0A133VLP4_9EURY|nr:hypothetical protein AKJ51_01520 [candidate division MSBL1 archaeon SCGC-AAA382A20]
MLKYKLKKRFLHKFFKYGTVLSDEGKVVFGKDGMRMKLVDPAHVCLLDISLSKGAFESYDDDSVEVGIEFSDISKFIKRFDFDDEIDMKFDVDDGHHMKMKARKEDLYTLCATRPLRDTAGMTDPSVPEFDLPCKFETSNKALREMIDYLYDCYNDQSYLKISFDEGTVEFHSDEDYDKNTMTLESIKVFNGEDKSVSSLFALDYAKEITKSIKKSADLKMELGEDYPVIIDFKFEDGLGEGTFWLAPRIESE